MSPGSIEPVDARFAKRVREFLAAKNMNLQGLATATGFEPSVLSRVTSENDATRRAPQLEHVFGIARALEKSAAELVQGTGAAEVLAIWIPKAVFEAESAARSAAQREAASLRSDVAGIGAQRDALRGQLAELEKRNGAVERALRTAQQERSTLLARAASADNERERALALAENNYLACMQATAQVQALSKQLEGTRDLATAGWVFAGLGVLGTILATAEE